MALWGQLVPQIYCISMKYAHGLHFLAFCSSWIKIQRFFYLEKYIWKKSSAIFQPMSRGLILLEMSLNMSAVISTHFSLCINILGIHWCKGSIIKIRQSHNHIYFVMGIPTLERHFFYWDMVQFMETAHQQDISNVIGIQFHNTIFFFAQ